MSQYTDDPVADFAAYDYEQYRYMRQLPECVECGEPITDEYCYEINDELVCDECMIKNHRKAVEDIE